MEECSGVCGEIGFIIVGPGDLPQGLPKAEGGLNVPGGASGLDRRSSGSTRQGVLLIDIALPPPHSLRALSGGLPAVQGISYGTLSRKDRQHNLPLQWSCLSQEA